MPDLGLFATWGHRYRMHYDWAHCRRCRWVRMWRGITRQAKPWEGSLRGLSEC